MTLQAKIGVATLTLGSSAIAGYALLAQKPQGTEIGKLIEEEFRYTLLDTKDGDGNTDSTLWQTKWENYKRANSGKDKDIFGLEGWTKEGTKELKTQLRKKCKALSKTKISNKAEEFYKNVTDYCSRDVAIKDEAKKDNLDLIDTSKSNGDWTKVAEKKANLTADFQNLGISASSGSDISADDIKKGCTEAINKHKGQENYENAYTSYKKVCTKPKEGN